MLQVQTGAELSQAYYDQVVRPLLDDRWPGLPHAAARLGSGSDVLGTDDEMSQDHDFGLRLNLLVPQALTAEIDAEMQARLPETFAGRPVRFPVTWDQREWHHADVDTVAAFTRSRLGIDATRELALADWLSLTGQAVLEIIAGPVFADSDGELTQMRRRLAWYPDDIWRYAVATDWARLAQELPFVGRTGQRGDDLGSRVIATRLAHIAMHLAHLLERRWPPYAKWLGTILATLPHGSAVIESLTNALRSPEWRDREAGLVEALRVLHQRQAEVGLPTVDDPIEPFWDRPFQSIRSEVVEVLHRSITDPQVRALPRGVGTAEQRSDNVDVLVHADRRRAAYG
ncbi:DUF4037 domain-containing protein [Calidifontibacter sp. DB0510]|uniref:DUF4037 domain-containing protein n=1 Tax=Metallococcus carri TaxID=1656884 RepID=A0A967B1E2_9MICO|nr:DUF4037 domain-containing protein [Metallococcus carri]NHN57021.1 DUF4037 domain-containing protein [Metallococcus carri]NOP39110.1 DUF4037 domain-containing protein [Calidifontibacter sp. DB2511S]